MANKIMKKSLKKIYSVFFKEHFFINRHYCGNYQIIAYSQILKKNKIKMTESSYKFSLIIFTQMSLISSAL